jgi:flagellar protein FlaI
MLNPLAAGLISFLVDGNRTLLVAGTRSAGKTSLLGGVMIEIMRRYRIITIEDTLELPTESLRNLGYNIQPLKVASALTKGTSEVPADEGIRTTLRLGDSALVVGEVRSTEATALYEAMRVGALANVVAGTIHGDSPYGVFDRVVNDLKVPRTSFKATDIIIVANPIKSPDGLHKWRRVTQITEVRKEWEDDPLREHGFVDLMKYNSKTDELEPTDELINGDSDILKAIAGNVKEWAGNWDAIWDNVMLRSKMKEELVKTAEDEKNLELLEAAFVIRCNDQFHIICDKVTEKTGRLDSERILFEWKEWLRKEIKKGKNSKESEFEP